MNTFIRKSIVEWFKVVPGMEKAAAFLETRRYTAYPGCDHRVQQDGRRYS